MSIGGWTHSNEAPVVQIVFEWTITITLPPAVSVQRRVDEGIFPELSFGIWINFEIFAFAKADERQFELPLGDSLLNPKIGFGIVR